MFADGKIKKKGRRAASADSNSSSSSDSPAPRRSTSKRRSEVPTDQPDAEELLRKNMAQQSAWRGSHRGEGSVAMSSSSRVRSTPPITSAVREPMVEDLGEDNNQFLFKSEFADAMATFKTEVTGE
eukprot:7503988-Karenia_brevis.AAC.1